MGRIHLALLLFMMVSILATGCGYPATPLPVTIIATVTDPVATKTPVRQPMATTTPVDMPTVAQVPTPFPSPLQSITPRPSEASKLIATATASTPVTDTTPQPGYIMGSAQVRVPILMYHYISVPPADADIYRLDLSVNPSDFEKQLAYLSENGYSTISLYDLYDHFALSATLPAKPIILTFDDGYRDAYKYAFPLLKKYGMSATLFIVSDFINNGYPPYLTWDMVKEMSSAGMDIESHSRSHPDMRNRSVDFLLWQILGPIESITAYTGKRPHFFCYPSGGYDDGVIRMLKSADVWGAVTTHNGTLHSLDDAMTWARVRIRGTTTLQQFAALVK